MVFEQKPFTIVLQKPLWEIDKLSEIGLSPNAGCHQQNTDNIMSIHLSLAMVATMIVNSHDSSEWRHLKIKFSKMIAENLS